MENKKCTHCNEVKPLNEFGSDGKHKGGLKSQCRKCCAEKLKSWRLNNLDHARERDRIWANKNKEKISKKNARRNANPTLDKKLTMLFNTALKSCGKRNLEFDITLSLLKDLWSKQNGLCAYTKLPLTSRGHQLNTVSLDRIDSGKGYVVGNVQLVCVYINRMKLDYSEHDFIRLCHLVSQNNVLPDNPAELAVSS